jgi:mannose-6-phosphate isomerase-like protein (cupin superfamily)
MSGKIGRRLVVTGHDASGLSRIASETVATGEEVPGQPGFQCSVIWGSDGRMQYPDDGRRPALTGLFPPAEGCRLIEAYIPARFAAGTAGFPAEVQPWMHRTATLDMVVILEGRCVLQLDRDQVELNTGDVLIESGTIHAWRNPYDEPCRFIAALVGAKNDLCE